LVNGEVALEKLKIVEYFVIDALRLLALVGIGWGDEDGVGVFVFVGWHGFQLLL